MKYREERQYVGNPEQLFSVRESRLVGGRADGVRVIDIVNGGNLSVTILPDSCMDIFCVRYKGKCLNYITPNGVTHPSYYEVTGEGWSESFSGGFLFTCGLSNVGIRSGNVWDAQKEHGCIGNRPAEHVNIIYSENEAGPEVLISGKMKEAMLAGTNLSLTRTIRMSYRTDTIEVTDVVKNEGFRRVPHMILYHCNMGWPLLSPDSVFTLKHKGVRPRTPFAEKMLPNLDEILPPQDNMEEMCYYYDVIPEEGGWTKAVLENPVKQLRMSLLFDTKTLPFLVQWKNFVKGEYVMGIEPTNTTIDGWEDAVNRGTMNYLDAGEEVS